MDFCADWKEQLAQRNCFPNPSLGTLMDDFGKHMVGLINEIEPYIDRQGQPVDLESPSPAGTADRKNEVPVHQPLAKLNNDSATNCKDRARCAACVVCRRSTQTCRHTL